VIAVDTNVLVRLLVEEEPEQSRRARRLIERNDVLVATTVLLETEWVLRSAYGFDRGSICGAFRRLLGLANVTPAEPAIVSQALDAFEAGVDFADALHLASTPRVEGFHTFDLKLARRARSLSPKVGVVPR
jgi:predicted nucleic-acid-binding protein